MTETDRVRLQWAQELRSGNYTQGKGMLKHKGCHCALGVLCELAKREGIYKFSDTSEGLGPNDSEPHFNLIPRSVAQWAGLSSREAGIGSGSFSHMNDTGQPFTMIADYIESTVYCKA